MPRTVTKAQTQNSVQHMIKLCSGFDYYDRNMLSLGREATIAGFCSSGSHWLLV
jgi:hypothetical protein